MLSRSFLRSLSRSLSLDVAGRGSSKVSRGREVTSPPPLKLSYSCLEDKRKEIERKGPVLIHHSLLGCRKNWKNVAKVPTTVD